MLKLYSPGIMKLKFIFLLLLFPLIVFSQKYTISGYIEDAETGEKLISASVINQNNFKGVVSNNYGFYSYTETKGNINLSFSYIGYKPFNTEFNLEQDSILNVSLQPNIDIEEVVVTGNRIENIVRRSQISMNEIQVKQIKNIPVLFGEVDVLKAIQLLPGVQSGSEGTSGFYVRGGGPDQNLILLDGVPVYNANHLFGFFSVFNADAISTVKLIKGGFPARYGGRLSSVLDIRMKEGNNKKFKGEGSIGIISSKLTLEGPLFNENTSFIISGRRTYIDILTQPLIKLQSSASDYDKFSAGYYFYDLNAKVNHKFSNKSRLYLSAYLGKDKAYLNSSQTQQPYYDANNFGLGWGNKTLALRWNYMITNKLFSNTTLTYSEYIFNTGLEMIEKTNDITDTEFEFEYISGIDDVAGKIDFDYIPNPNHNIKFGINNIYHTFKPGVNTFYVQLDENAEPIDTTFGNKEIYANEYSAYVEDDFRIGALFKANIGLHYSGFLVNKAFYHSIQPRISARYLITENLSVKAAYSEMSQYIHLLTNTSIGMPTDLWLPVTENIKPQQSTQFAVGAALSLNKIFDVSLEGFYKKMDRLIEYKEGASFLSFDNSWEDKIETGEGWAYGLEFLLEKKTGKTTGWLGYTLSWANRQFENISFGEIFPYKYDRRHDLSFVLMHKFNEKVDIGLTWVYGTGNAVTLSFEKYSSLESSMESDNYDYYYALGWNPTGNDIEYFEKRNNYRMPSYHRLDLGVNFHKTKKWGERTWSFGVYNAYNRKNPFILMFDGKYNNIGEYNTQLIQYSLFPIIPSIAYSFKF
ncbi:TonB-dependent receptor plug domain-containing protein [Bacteroidota bacterium]